MLVIKQYNLIVWFAGIGKPLVEDGILWGWHEK
jgi:hypothetical protein